MTETNLQIVEPPSDEVLTDEELDDVVDGEVVEESGALAGSLFEAYVVRSEDAEAGKWFPCPGLEHTDAEIFVRPASNEDFEAASAAIWQKHARDGRLPKNVYRCLMPSLLAETIMTKWRRVPALSAGQENTGRILVPGCRVWVLKNGKPRQVTRGVEFQVDDDGFMADTESNRRRAFLVMQFHVPVTALSEDPKNFSLPAVEDVKKTSQPGSTG